MVCLLGLLLALVIANCVDTLQVEKQELHVGELLRTFYVQYPRGVQQPKHGWPAVFSFHGFGGWADSQAEKDGLRSLGAEQAVIIHPEGFADKSTGSYGRVKQSWNGAGSSGANVGDGVDGPICDPSSVRTEACFESCDKRNLCIDKCRWAHCEDDVSFVIGILEKVQKTVQVNPSRIYGTGHSNGALFLYELAADPRSASMFAALVPVAGLPHNGFNRGSSDVQTRLLAILGTEDTYVYPYANVQTDKTKSYGNCCGWYFSEWSNTTNLWASRRKLQLSSRVALSSKDTVHKCQGWSRDDLAEHAEIAACFYEGGHNPPKESYSLVWHFFGFLFEDDIDRELCVKTEKCGSYSCDDWIKWDSDRYSCDILEHDWGCDCTGCSLCTVSKPLATVSTYGFTACLVIGVVAMFKFVAWRIPVKPQRQKES